MDEKCVLTIAGSDSSGGAGIQADLKTIAAHLLYGESVITALTAQNTCGVRESIDVPPSFVTAQMEAVFEDIRPDAVKIGMVSSAGIVRAVAEGLFVYDAANIVVDPVMVATSGAALMAEGVASVLVDELFPLATVVTPNIAEAEVLTGMSLAGGGLDALTEAAHAIAGLTPGAVLIKGGHADDADECCDVLLLPDAADPIILHGPRIATSNTHGTGCTLSSAIACGLAEGMDIEQAVTAAKSYLTACLEADLDLGRGCGPVDHMAPWRVNTGDAEPEDGPSNEPADEPADKPADEPADEPAEASAPAFSATSSAPRTRILVVGGSPVAPSPHLLGVLAMQADIVVACDAGADACLHAQVPIDVYVGDDDSASSAGIAYAHSTARSELIYPTDKDDVDMDLAMAWIRKQCPDVLDVTFTGFSGGRCDHLLAAVGIAARAADLRPSIEEDTMSMRILSVQGQREWSFGAPDVGRTVSVIPLLGDAVVSEAGMRWNLEHTRLTPLDDHGISNVIERLPSSVYVHEGVILVTMIRERILKTPGARQDALWHSDNRPQRPAQTW